MSHTIDVAKKDAAIQRIAGVSPWADQVRRTIEFVAAHQSSVLIMGPSGTGKELIARAIHASSGRSAKPFIPVDCAVTTGTLFASHMFGGCGDEQQVAGGQDAADRSIRAAAENGAARTRCRGRIRRLTGRLLSRPWI